MKWEELLKLVGDEPVFPTSFLLSGNVSPRQVRLQLARWVKTGRLLSLRRGLYSLAPAWRRAEPHPFLVANQLSPGSYVSLQSALAHHGVIPEHVAVVTSVGPGRPETVRNALGTYQFSHLSGTMIFGYSRLEVAPRQFAFTASPEKALLDLVYLTKGADSPEFVRELRLGSPEEFDLALLGELAQRSGRPKLVRAAKLVGPFLSDQKGATP